MRNKFNFIFFLLLIAIYYKWFSLPYIIGGDWPYFFDETLKEFPFLVPSWNTWQANGLGGINPVYFLHSFENATVFFTNATHIPWVIIYKIFWFGLFLFFSF